MRVEKQPDTALYSKKADLQYAYLINRSIIGRSADYGIGRSLIRYRFCNPFSLKSSEIQHANYFTYNISRLNKKHAKQNFKLNTVLDDWCSILVNWKDNIQIGKQTSEYNGDDAVLAFDITDEVKKWCDEPTGLAERKGVMLQSSGEKEKDFDVILSNDNALFRTRTEVILNKGK